MIWPVVTRMDWALDPYHELNRLHRQIAGLFDAPAVSNYPAINVSGNAEEAVLHAALPGVDEKSLNISVSGDTLTVEGERKSQVVEPTAEIRRERDFGSFSRTVQLPFEVESDAVAARYENGLLTVNLPRKESSKPRKIAITQS